MKSIGLQREKYEIKRAAQVKGLLETDLSYDEINNQITTKVNSFKK